MHKDPVLAAHLVSQNCFEIGGEFSPASIRDQMVRARLVADRLIEHGRIDDKGRNFLVIGAGPTGLTAAIRAADAGVKTVVVDKRDPHAFLLGACTSRDVEPTLYDWPAVHWAAGSYPWAGEEMPLEWDRGKASAIAASWAKRLKLWKKELRDTLEIRDGTMAWLEPGGTLPTIISDDVAEVSFIPAPYAPQRFGAVLSCVGWGEERHDSLPYRGFDFWDRDDFEQRYCGLPSQPRVLISGGGDGALQDLIRILTGGSTERAFGIFLTAMRGYESVLSTISGEILAAEDIARRAWSWNENDEQDGIVLSKLEAAHVRAIDHLEISSAWPAVESAVRKLLVDSDLPIYIMHRKSYFSHCYALNRFIALLLLKIAPNHIRRPRSEVLQVRGALGHDCSNDPTDCHGKPHYVDFLENDVRGTEDFDAIILRHGVKGPKRIFTGAHPARVRQILPYFLHD